MPTRFMVPMLVVNVIVSAINDPALSIWWLMFVACWFIILISVLRRRYSPEVRAHKEYITEVKTELLKGLYRKRFKNILTRHGWAEDGTAGIAAISLSEAYLNEWVYYERL
ncbi:hypothetical protein SMB93_003556 [Cronobacter sakazakii]|nr:hypothetical protein [Cronobacter sakazakii]